jgi:asparagine synthase (glutamine-hydrolysing)
MQVLLDKQYNWHTSHEGDLTYHYIGDLVPVWALVELLSSLERPDPAMIAETLLQQIGHFAAIIEADEFLVATVDTVRSFPLFYATASQAAIISNSARLVRDHNRLKEVDPLSLLEFSMSGYVTGPDTLYQNLLQLQAGEFLFFDKTTGQLACKRYYQYQPHSDHSKTKSDWLDQLDIVTNNIFQRVIEKADGAPIWVPLSGGYDSRLIVCKLVELGYPDIFTFSYGPRGNFEAQRAKFVADTLGLPWQFFEPDGSRARRLFQSSERRRFWNFADGLSSFPVMNEYEPLLTFRERGQLPPNSVLVNGQSGDFIVGGHIPKAVFEAERESIQPLLDYLISKHFSQWQHLVTPKNVQQLEEKALRLLPLDPTGTWTAEELAAWYEEWEWQERQAKHVVNGQRLYDFLGLKWSLPLWDIEFMKFWQEVPLELRFGQRLYIDYLEQYDYRGLFKNIPAEKRRTFGLLWRVVHRTTGVVRRFRGQQAAKHFQKRFNYFGHYGNLYALYGYGYVSRHMRKTGGTSQAVGFLSLGVDILLQENNILGKSIAELTETESLLDVARA